MSFKAGAPKSLSTLTILTAAIGKLHCPSFSAATLIYQSHSSRKAQQKFVSGHPLDDGENDLLAKCGIVDANRGIGQVLHAVV
jgi:hypothetical protein